MRIVVHNVAERRYVEAALAKIDRFTLAIAIDPEEPEAVLIDDRIVRGTCRVCGCETAGLDPDDDKPLTIDRYEHLMELSAKDEWYCDSCWRHRCDQCDEPSDSLSDVDGESLCAKCAAEPAAPNSGADMQR